MSVSHPLLKKLKGFIFQLRTDPDYIRDEHRCMLGFCETLEEIFRNGLKESGGFLGLNKIDYWQWIEGLSENSNATTERSNPVFNMCVSHIKESNKLRSSQGRGRYFIRIALQKKILLVPIEQLRRSAVYLAWYDTGSIFGNEILTEILMSLLYEATEIKFRLNVRICSFLDESWYIPMFHQYEFVPCDDLGVRLHYIDGRALVTSVEAGSVADEDRKVEPGDVLDDLYGECLRGARKGKMQNLMKEHQGMPVYLSVVKGRMHDGSFFPPIAALIRSCRGYPKLQEILNKPKQPAKVKGQTDGDKRIPPHALLPEDEYEEVPVHNEDDKASYSVLYIGKVNIGTDGGVSQVEVAIAEALKREHLNQNMILKLGETDVILTVPNSDKVVMKYSYTQISACGRRVEHVSHFCFIAGETTCTLAQQFVAHVFRARSDEECKTMICSIAQGFDRTHWFI